MKSVRVLRKTAVVMAAALLASACATNRTPPADVVTVEGVVTVRGNEPFAAYVLETEDRNFYVLDFEEATPPDTPAGLRVTGRLYRGEWDGRPYARIEVHAFEPGG